MNAGETAPQEHPTQSRLLQTILTDLCVLKDNLILNRDKTPLGDVLHYLKVIMQECTELLQSTTSFDSQDQRTSFFEAVNHALQTILATLEVWDDHDKLLKNVYERAEAQRSSETRSSFVPDLNSWDQFLNPGAPGVQSMATDTHGNKSMRLIPPAGAAILTRWNEDIYAVSTITNPPSSLPQALNLSAEEGCSWTLATHTVPRNTFSRRTEPVRGGDVPGVAEALSTLGRDLAMFERRCVPLMMATTGAFVTKALKQQRNEDYI